MFKAITNLIGWHVNGDADAGKAADDAARAERSIEGGWLTSRAAAGVWGFTAACGLFDAV